MSITFMRLHILRPAKFSESAIRMEWINLSQRMYSFCIVLTQGGPFQASGLSEGRISQSWMRDPQEPRPRYESELWLCFLGMFMLAFCDHFQWAQCWIAHHRIIQQTVHTKHMVYIFMGIWWLEYKEWGWGSVCIFHFQYPASIYLVFTIHLSCPHIPKLDAN